MSPEARMELRRSTRPIFLRMPPSVRFGLWLKHNFGWITVGVGLLWVWWRDGQ